AGRCLPPADPPRPPAPDDPDAEPDRARHEAPARRVRPPEPADDLPGRRPRRRLGEDPLPSERAGEGARVPRRPPPDPRPLPPAAGQRHLVRPRRAQAAEARHVHARRRRRRPRRQRHAEGEAEAARDRRPLHRPHASPRARPPRRLVHRPRRDRRADLQLDAERPPRHEREARAAAEGTAEGRDLRPRRRGERAHGPDGGDRERRVIDLARIAGPVACLGLAVLLGARGRGNRIAGLGFAVFGTIFLIASLAPDRPAELGAAGGAAVVLGPALALLFRREPWLIAYGTLAFIPIRVGFLGHQLLVPLYVVALGAAVLLAWQLVGGDERARELGVASKPLACFVGWIGISLAWSEDVHEGAIEVLAFYIPFAILALAIARLPRSSLRLRLLGGELAAMALGFAVFGLYQYETRNVFQNPKVITSNAYAAFFRVNSVFWDPSVYGRFLVVALIPAVVLIVRGRSARAALAGAAFALVAWLGLLISFSQSSFAALLVGVIGVAAVAWRWRAVGAVLAAAAVLAGLAASEPRVRHALVHHTSSGLNSATSGRASLVANGIRIAIAHPAAGVGVGGFKRAYAKRVHLKGKEPKTAASHNTPVTVAAESGVVGLALFAWLLLALCRDAFRRVDRSFAGRVSLAAGLALAAIFVHSLFYNDFFEDPTTWGLVGLVALAVPGRAAAEEPPPAVEKKEPVAV